MRFSVNDKFNVIIDILALAMVTLVLLLSPKEQDIEIEAWFAWLRSWSWIERFFNT